MPFPTFSSCLFTEHKADQEQNISGHAADINTTSPPQTFNADAEKCCDISVPPLVQLVLTMKGDQWFWPAGGGQGCIAITSFENHFPTPSLEMVFPFQCLQLQHQTTNGSVSISRRACFLCSYMNFNFHTTT